jgi:hypothetical protein
MRKEEVSNIIDSLIPKFFGYAYTLCADDSDAKQLVADAYTIFVIQESENLVGMSVDLTDHKSRISIKKVLMTQMFQAMFELAAKRNELIKERFQEQVEFEQFFSMSAIKRSTMFLKEVYELSVENIQEIYIQQRHQVIENLHNSRSGLLSDVDGLSSLKRPNSILDRSKMALIGALVNGTIRVRDQQIALTLINSDESYNNYYQMKMSENEFLKQLIPDHKISKNIYSDLRFQVRSINDDVYPKEKFNFIKKAMNYLNEPLIEI